MHSLRATSLRWCMHSAQTNLEVKGETSGRDACMLHKASDTNLDVDSEMIEMCTMSNMHSQGCMLLLMRKQEDKMLQILMGR